MDGNANSTTLCDCALCHRARPAASTAPLTESSSSTRYLAECFATFCSDCVSKVIAESERIAARDRKTLEAINTEGRELSWNELRDAWTHGCSSTALDFATDDPEDFSTPSQALTGIEVLNLQAVQDWRMSVGDLCNSADEERRVKAALLEDACLRKQVKKAHDELQRLKKFHLLNRCFFIWVVGEFGVINGCRLGRSSETEVPIDEVNNALGDVALLMQRLVKETDTMCRKQSGEGYRSRVGRILAKGRHSWIVASDSEFELPVFLTDNRVGLYFHLPKFNQALGLLLALFSELVQTLSNTLGQPITEPFAVHRHTVAGESVIYRRGSEVGWTAALRYFLINLKWLIGQNSQLKLQLNHL